MSGRWVGVDVGGSKVSAGVLADHPTPGDPAVVRRVQAPTPPRAAAPAALEDLVVEVVVEAAGGEPLAGVGVAAAGFVDAAGERVVFAPHLPWRGEDVRDRLSRRWGVPVRLENDATAAAHGEAVLGAARDRDPALLVALGTGIGGGLVVGGRLVRGAHGMAGEFGHAQVVPEGHPCPCGKRGCWEQYASGRALERLAREAVAATPSTLAERCAGDPARITGEMVAAAADEGDVVALRAFEAVGDWLGVGLASLVAGIDPAVVVVGGGLSRAGERLLAPARTALARALVGVPHRGVPPVLAAELGADAGLVGAALLARSPAGS